jgi:hypothetical protein
MSNGHIFISYRRDDSAGYTRAIYDQLAERFTQERIFMDVDAIEPGLPFDEVINQAVSRCEILLVIIGKRWMEQQPGVGPRINDPKDFVRLEIAAALSRNVRVIPVLLDGAGMPTEEVLPEPLRALARRNAIEISNTRFKSDLDRLVEAVSKVLGESNAPPTQKRSRFPRTMQYWLLGGFIVVALFSLIVYFNLPTNNGHPGPRPPSLRDPVSDLCNELEDKSIDFNVNNYHGVISSTGIKLKETKLGTFEFETAVVFPDEPDPDPNNSGQPLSDPINGVCQDNLITLDRKLWPGGTHTYTGQLRKAQTGRTEMQGHFVDRGNSYTWSGWIYTPVQK